MVCVTVTWFVSFNITLYIFIICIVLVAKMEQGGAEGESGKVEERRGTEREKGGIEREGRDRERREGRREGRKRNPLELHQKFGCIH